MKDYELSDLQAQALQEESRQAGKVVCGLDEAGRGALAGPVVAAAVVFVGPVPAGLNDSKVLTARRREAMFENLKSCALIGVGIVDVETIDRINILQANFLAMQAALAQLRTLLNQTMNFVIVDGNFLTPAFRDDCQAAGAKAYALVKGDSKVPEISAASVIAKVTRDRIMMDLDVHHPGFGFATSAGYPSPAHMTRIAQFGPSLAHRRTFAPVAAALKARSTA